MRTTVFCKGCPLDCLWCHNPESKSTRPQLSFMAVRCIGCRACEAVCPQGAHAADETGKRVAHDRCIACGACVKACPTGALELLGRQVSVEEVLHEVERDRIFYRNSGGGMTLSGGDPTMQPDFAEALLRAAHEKGIHTAMETAGHTDWRVMERLLPHLDLILYDNKQMDPDLHQKYTGKSNDRILANLRRLSEAGETVQIIVRTPVIPGYNDDPENFRALAAFLLTLDRVPTVEALPYNPLAGAKHPRLGMNYPLDTDESRGNSPDMLCAILQDAGLTARVLR